MASDELPSNKMSFSSTMNYIHPLRISYEIPKAFVISHDSQTLYIAKNAIHAIDIYSVSILCKFYDSDVPITFIAISDDDSRLASADESGKVQVFDTRSYEILNTITNLKSFIPFIKFFPNSNEKMIIGYQEKVLECWNLTTKEFKKLEYGNYVMGSALSQNGKSLYVVGEDEMTLYNLENDKFEKKQFQGEFNVEFTHDQTHLILTNWKGSVTIINLVNFSSKVFDDSINDGWLNNLVVSHDDSLVAATGASKNIFVYSIKNPSLFHIFERNCAVEVKSVIFTKDSRYIISSYDTVYICLWDLATKEKRIIGQHHGKIFDAKMTGNGRRFVTCAEDGIKVWDAYEFECIGKVAGHADEVLGAVLNKEKTKLVSSGCDNVIKFWNLATGKETKTIDIGKCFVDMNLTANNYIVGSYENIIYVYKRYI